MVDVHIKPNPRRCKPAGLCMFGFFFLAESAKLSEFRRKRKGKIKFFLHLQMNNNHAELVLNDLKLVNR